MAKQPGLNTWLNRTTKRFLEQVSSGGMAERFPPDVFDDGNGQPISNANWIHAPDMSAVAAQPNKYWIITGDIVTLMDQALRDAVDAQIAADKLQAEKNDAKQEGDGDANARRILGFMDLMVDEINLLRAALSITPARTLDDYKSGVSTRIDEQT